MAMKPCQSCLENNWTFNKLDSGDIQATCDHCDYEVEWTPKQKSEKIYCCGEKLGLKEAHITPKKLKKPYYYTAYRHCENCRKNYYIEKFKVFTGINVNQDLIDEFGDKK